MHESRFALSRRRFCALGVYSVPLLLGACRAGGATRSPSSGAPASPAPSGAQRAGPITVQDQRGKTITLARPATRIVAIPFPAPSLLMAIDGSSDHVVGINPAAAQAIKGQLLGEILPGARSIASNVASETFVPNVEAILALKPDVVIQWGDRGPDIIAPIENVGLPVIGLKVGTQEDLATWMAIFGALLGKADRAAQIIAWQHQQRDALQTGHPASTPPSKVLYFLRAKPDLNVSGAGTYNDYYIRLIGAENAAMVTGMVSVGAEQILRWNPDVIVLGNFDSAVPADIYANTLWKEISAVKNRRVYKAPLGGYRWDPPSQESPLMWRWLAQLTYPDQIAGDLRQEIRQAYQLLYLMQPTDAQLDRILQLKVNEGAAYYDRFAQH